MARSQRLPVLPTQEIRPSRISRWRAGVLIAVHLLIAVHIAHWLVAGETITPVEPSEAMAYSKAGIVNAGLIVFAAAILVTAVFGRWFCGWSCHLVALQDLCRYLLEKIGIRPRPLRSRLLAIVPYLAFVYMFLWPAAYRLWIGDRLGVRGSEYTTSAFWETFPGWTVGALTLLICGFATVYFLGAKGFCTYACPYGAAFSLADKLAPMRVRADESCEGSGHCTAVCTSNVRVHEEVALYRMVVDSGCMKCGDCVSVCPTEALRFGFGAPALFATRPASPAAATGDLAKRTSPLSWIEELVAAGAFFAAFLAFRGLYGEVPFLMSLGLAGVLAFLTLLVVRLVRRRDFAFRRSAWKRDGKLLPAGRWFLAAALAIGLLWVHSGWLQFEIASARRSFVALAEARRAALAIGDPSVAPSEADRMAASATAARLLRVERWGLFPWLGLDGQLAWSAWLAGDRATFRTANSRALFRKDNLYEMLLLAARDAADRGDLAGLTLAGERAVAFDPTRFEAYAGAGILLAQSGAPAALDAASSLFERGSARFPASPVLAYNWGIAHALQGRPELAIENFRQVMRLDPGNREARENLAGMLAQVGRLEEASALYREAIAASPGDADLHVLLAQAWIAMGRDEAAREELTTALKIRPGHPQASALAAALAAPSPIH